MRVAILGRNNNLLNGARKLYSRGHEIPLVGTCLAADHHSVDSKAYEEFADSVGANFFNDVNINRKSRVTQLEAARCEVAVSANWPILAQRSACEAFSDGILNVHAGELPRYRGNACPNWAILNSEVYTGLTIHKMNPVSIDSGPILLRDRLALTSETYVGDIHTWLSERIPPMIVEAVESLGNGTAKLENQATDPTTWLRCYPRRPEDSRIDWNLSAQQIYRLIRASSRPFSGAYCTLEGDRMVTIWRAKPTDHIGRFLAMPGHVLYQRHNDPVIACGEGLLQLTEVMVDGYESNRESKSAIAKSLRNRLV